GSIGFTAQLRREQSGTHLRGQAANGGVTFECRLHAIAEGGRVEATPESITVAGANAATLFVTAGTDYRLHFPDFKGDDPAASVPPRLDAVAAKPSPRIRDAPLAEHRRLFRRAALSLGGADRSVTPTDERLSAMQQGGDDPQLIALYFQFGRYLLLSSS